MILPLPAHDPKSCLFHSALTDKGNYSYVATARISPHRMNYGAGIADLPRRINRRLAHHHNFPSPYKSRVAFHTVMQGYMRATWRPALMTKPV